MFPAAILIIPFLIMYRDLGLLDTRHGLIIAYTAFGVPFVVWVMRDFFLGLPVEIEESALVDGCTRFGVLTRIVLPLAAPGLVAVFILTMIGAWNEYLFALVLTFSESVTIPLFLQLQTQSQIGTQWWNLAAISLVSVVPVVAAGLLLERYITRGLTFGAVKQAGPVLSPRLPLERDSAKREVGDDVAMVGARSGARVGGAGSQGAIVQDVVDADD
jgi:multiple sugar transport system permease protein